MKIHKGDIVKIITGKDLGKTGKVEKAFPSEGKVLVGGVGFVKKHTRPERAGQKGGIIRKAKPVDVSNVMLVCQKCAQPARVGCRREGQRKARFCKKCEQEV